MRRAISHGHCLHRSRKLSLPRCSSGLRKYSITRRLPVLISTPTAMPAARWPRASSMAWGSSRSRLLRDWGLLQFKRRRQEGRLVRQALRRVKFLADFPELAKDGAKAAQQVEGGLQAEGQCGSWMAPLKNTT
jgi:hypothetical protein